MSLKIHNLSKSFGEKPILTGFSYDFSDTGIYILRGKSGIGKTTLLRIIAGLDKEYSGNVSGGAKNVSYAFQEYRLFPELDVLENVMIASKTRSAEDTAEAKRLLFSLGFNESELTLRPSELSGGMKQRVSLCRAFLKDAPILLLDEPTKELDHALCERLYEIIREISRDKLVIVVTHNDEDFKALAGETIQL